MVTKEIRKRLRQEAIEKDALFLQKFFKTGAGQYGEGDVFLGIRVPVLRKLAREYKTLLPSQVLPLLHSAYHEERLFALIILVNAFAKGDETLRRQIYDLYLASTRYINNWDLVDISAPNIAGAFLMDKDRRDLYLMAQSASLWERRIAMLATLYFIRKNQFTDALQISGLLVRDTEDLIHKASGWMLREVGKRDINCAELFLQKHCKIMPRTMLRYAIEKFPEAKRQMYLKGNFHQRST
jgi:3-methyladenine DNA glycosylase AlkD